ncbi:MAG: hypothetical protein IJX98_07185 [Clostridia bacterium]|nr:hypothetical protein [Clostridia bacterium]
MKCRKNQATKTYERVFGGKKREEYYCLSCFHESFVSVESDGTENGKSYEVCPYCGTSEETLKKTSLVGCAKCYKTIGKTAIPMLIRMQGVEAHRGKSAATSNSEHIRLRLEELATLIKVYRETGENERAKKCLDEYNKLNRRLSEGGNDGKFTRIH